MKYYLCKSQYEDIPESGIVDTSQFNTTKTDYHDIEIETQSCFSCDRDFIESDSDIVFCNECRGEQ